MGDWGLQKHSVKLQNKSQVPNKLRDQDKLSWEEKEEARNNINSQTAYQYYKDFENCEH